MWWVRHLWLLSHWCLRISIWLQVLRFLDLAVRTESCDWLLDWCPHCQLSPICDIVISGVGSSVAFSPVTSLTSANWSQLSKYTQQWEAAIIVTSAWGMRCDTQVVCRVTAWQASHLPPPALSILNFNDNEVITLIRSRPGHRTHGREGSVYFTNDPTASWH